MDSPHFDQRPSRFSSDTTCDNQRPANVACRHGSQTACNRHLIRLKPALMRPALVGRAIAIAIRPTAAWLLFLAEFSARNPKSQVPRPGGDCQDVLCACNEFFIIVIHRFLCLVSCPKQGTILRTQNLKSSPQRRAALSRQTAAKRGTPCTARAARPLFLHVRA
jgi:hypothetical protein